MIGSHRGRILIIDDSELILELARETLVSAGYDVITTSQAVGASRHLGSIDLVIIDFHMPGFDGKDMVESMRRSMQGSMRRCHIYLYSSDEEVARAFRPLGFDGCFTEKGDMRLLLEQVDAVFRMVQMRGIAERIRKALGPSRPRARGHQMIPRRAGESRDGGLSEACAQATPRSRRGRRGSHSKRARARPGRPPGTARST